MSDESHAPPSLIQNWLSLLGILVAACSFLTVVTLMIVDFLSPFAHPYMGILTYLAVPAFLSFGLMMIVAGIVLERDRRRRAAPGAIPQFPRLDLNLPKHRNVCLGVIIGAFVFALMTTLGSYRAYQFTESVQFCGLTCHSVMKPEHTAYTNSPHARVTCTECHIGPGATWFARSKLSGTYQIYATLADKFERPIPTPLKNLRPAQETCEHCHWPQKFFGAVERVRTHFLSDEQNSPWTIRMLLKVGGGDPNHGPVGGIHWHMNVANRVEYIAQDDARQIIPWVRVTDRDGTATVYQSEGSKLTPEQIAKGPVRRMDCIDCHNRPTHIFRSPNESLDTALSVGRIDPAIPFIRKTAAAALVQPCATEAQGRDQIAEKLGVYYANYKDPAKTRAAIAEVQRIHRDNFFPEMKVNWRVYPDNIGHLNWPGCFRCHDGEHVSESGKKISAECNDCHTLIAQGRGASLDTVSAKGLEFQHPSDEIPPGAKCADCHTGGPQQ